MDPNEMARLYGDAAENLSRSWLEAGSAVFAANRRLADAARLWGDEARAAQEVLARAARRSGEETRDVFGAGEGPPDAASLVLRGWCAPDILWTAATLAGGAPGTGRLRGRRGVPRGSGLQIAASPGAAGVRSWGRGVRPMGRVPAAGVGLGGPDLVGY